MQENSIALPQTKAVTNGGLQFQRRA